MEQVVMKDELIPENPDTGQLFPSVLIGGGILLAMSGYFILRRKNKFKKI